MSGESARKYLEELCRQLDDGRLQQRLAKVVATTALPVSLLISGCAYEAYAAAPMYGAPPWDGGEPEDEVCHDGIDNDLDGSSDCADSECAGLEICLGCHDELENDGNGLADCSDPSCADTESCIGGCDDGVDDDADGRTDCADPDCAGVDPCS